MGAKLARFNAVAQVVVHRGLEARGLHTDAVEVMRESCNSVIVLALLALRGPTLAFTLDRLAFRLAALALPRVLLPPVAGGRLSGGLSVGMLRFTSGSGRAQAHKSNKQRQVQKIKSRCVMAHIILDESPHYAKLPE
jgi:hypothetical protein